MPVSEGIKMIKQKGNELFNSEARKFSVEVARMIESIDENQIRNYVKDELENRKIQRHVQRAMGIYMKNELVNEEVKKMADESNKLKFSLDKTSPQNEAFDQLDIQAVVKDPKLEQKVEQNQKLGDIYVKTVDDIFRSKNLLLLGKYTDSMESKKRLKQRFKQKIQEVISHLQNMKLSLDTFIKKKIVSKTPFERQGSQSFFMAVKVGDMQKIQKMLKKNGLYVYDFDYIHQTALHWAAKRNNYQLIELLIDYGANVNAHDISGRTPLYLASKEGNLEAVKELLAAKAVPIYKTHSGKNSFDVAKTAMIERYLTKAQLLYICMKLIPANRRKQVWENEGLYYFQNKTNITDI